MAWESKNKKCFNSIHENVAQDDLELLYFYRINQRTFQPLTVVNISGKQLSPTGLMVVVGAVEFPLGVQHSAFNKFLNGTAAVINQPSKVCRSIF